VCISALIALTHDEDRTYSPEAGLTATIYTNIALISNTALAVSTCLVCVLFIGYSLLAAIFWNRGWDGHFIYRDSSDGSKQPLLGEGLGYNQQDSSVLSFLGQLRHPEDAKRLRHDFLNFMYGQNVFRKYKSVS
jgi:hypothetical protein